MTHIAINTMLLAFWCAALYGRTFPHAFSYTMIGVCIFGLFIHTFTI